MFASLKNCSTCSAVFLTSVSSRQCYLQLHILLRKAVERCQEQVSCPLLQSEVVQLYRKLYGTLPAVQSKEPMTNPFSHPQSIVPIQVSSS